MYQRDVAKDHSAVLCVNGNDRDPRQEDDDQVDDSTEKENWITELKKILVDIHFEQRISVSWSQKRQTRMTEASAWRFFWKNLCLALDFFPPSILEEFR